MLQELAARTGASGWAVASMLFFIGVWAFVAVRVLRARRDEMDARARLPFEESAPVELPEGPGRQA